ncbi:MAG: hypothetical protein HN348_04315 [Proteobacteria bacterium]|jgi:DNA repair exonuclease SbcCD ATPase subunit|nr:hypothetical protein [Pseudomonadota bacterium]
MRFLSTALVLLTLSTSALAQPPGPPKGPHGPEFGEGPPLSPELIEGIKEREDRILEKIQMRSPERYDELMLLKESDPDTYLRRLFQIQRMAKQHGPKGGPPPGLDPEVMERMQELHGEIHDLSRDFDDLSKKDQEARRDELHDLAFELFDLRQQERAARLQEMEKRVEEMKVKLKELEGDLEDRKHRKDEIVDEYVEAVLRGPVDL